MVANATPKDIEALRWLNTPSDMYGKLDVLKRVVTPVSPKDAWGFAEVDSRRRVGHTVVGYYEVSTVFLTLKHGSFTPDDPPLWFETMTFYKGPGDDKRDEAIDFDGFDRYATWESAAQGHRRIVREAWFAHHWSLRLLMRLKAWWSGEPIPRM